jgi:VWFA-related protein
MAASRVRPARTALSALTLLAFLTAGPFAQTSPPPPAPPESASTQNTTPTFRSGVQFVEVDVTVVDRKGRPVRGLTRDDFEVYEDGVLQMVESFRPVDIPLPPRTASRGNDARPVAPRDVTSNPADGRVYVMLLDGAGGAPLLRTRLAARRFVAEALGPDDLMAMIVVNGLSTQSHGFTSDKARLLSIIDRFGGARWEGVDDALISVSERSSATGDAYGLIRQLAERMGNIPGRRKSILWVGGAPQFHHLDFRQAEEAFMQRDAIRAASRNNVAVYPIDPHGLTGAMGIAELERQAGFRVIAEDTGGEAVVNTNNFSGMYRRIVELNSAFYVMGYTPAVSKDDGRFHRITVKVNRPGLSVRTKRGYTAPTERQRAASLMPLSISDATLSALRSPLPVSGLALTMFTSPFKGEDGRGSVVIGAQLHAADLRLDGGQEIEVARVAIDTEGRALEDSVATFTLNLRERDTADQGGLRYFDRLDLPPGRHEIRLVVHQPGGVTGSLVGHVEVPDFSRKAVTISGLIVSALSDPPGRTLRDDATVQKALAANPTITRQFTTGDTVTAWAEIYDNRNEPPKTIPVASRILSSSGDVVMTRSRVLSAGDPLTSRFDYRERFELGDLAPGDYVLEVEAGVAAKKKPRVMRTLPFTIVSR